MAENLIKINMILLYFFLFFNEVFEVKSKEEFIPTLIWTSKEFQGRKNLDYLVMKKIKSDLFESYLMELLGGKKPLIVIFLEQILSTDDFEWKDTDGSNSFPFLSNLTVSSRVDYFRSVENPHKTLFEFYNKGYKWKNLKPGVKLNANNGEVLLMEFEKIKNQRPETMKKHDQQMQDIHRQLLDSGKSWISIYTAKHTDSKSYLSDLKQLSPWFVEGKFQEKPTKVVSLYHDEFTGHALMTKGCLQLYLPSPKNLAVKILENYLGASAKPSGTKMDFVIWFPDYTLISNLNRTKGEWLIEGAKLLNGNGDTLKLILRNRKRMQENKCYVQVTELQSEGKPAVKIILSKYKLIKVQHQEEPCKKSHEFHLIFLVITVIIISVIVSWKKILEKLDFSRKAKIVRIPTEYLLSFSS